MPPINPAPAESIKDGLTALIQLRPSAAVEAIWGVKLWSQQALMLDTIFRPDLRENKNHIAVRSGHKIGKTEVLMWSTILWLITHQPGTVILIAPTDDDICNLHLDKIRKRLRQFNPLPSVPGRDSWRLGDEWGILAYSMKTLTTEKLQGKHNPNGLLIAIDEASGLNHAFFEPLLSYSGPPDKFVLLLAGNPLWRSGPFYDAFQSDLWHTMHISSLKSPNITKTERPIPGLADAGLVRLWMEREGEDSTAYKVRILGEFPDVGEDELIPYSILKACASNTPPPMKRPLYLCVDPGRSEHGDPAVILLTDTHGVFFVESMRGARKAELMARINAVAEEWSPDEIRVDAGGLGIYLVDDLEDEAKYKILGVSFARRAHDSGSFANTRAEGYALLRRGLEKLYIPRKYIAAFLAEAGIQRAYLNGRMKVEDKDEYKKRTGRSPDHLDALMLAFVRPLGDSFIGDIDPCICALTPTITPDQDPNPNHLYLLGYPHIPKDRWWSGHLARSIYLTTEYGSAATLTHIDLSGNWTVIHAAHVDQFDSIHTLIAHLSSWRDESDNPISPAIDLISADGGEAQAYHFIATLLSTNPKPLSAPAFINPRQLAPNAGLQTILALAANTAIQKTPMLLLPKGPLPQALLSARSQPLTPNSTNPKDKNLNDSPLSKALRLLATSTQTLLLPNPNQPKIQKARMNHAP
jgi:hypothetical protein